jgi:non-ribosomal peptide synthase protein (TIGR01720 family)
VTVLSATLSAAETSRLRVALAAVPGSSPRDAVLAAVVRAERACAGRSEIAVQLEGHGRDAWTGDLDVSRTVGWFTALYPFFAHDGTGTSADAGWREAVARIRDDLATLPEPVAGYGMLRAYGGLAAIDAAATRIGFNYLGEFAPSRDAAVFRLLHELPTGAVAESFERDHALDVSAWIGEDCLQVQIAFREEDFRRDEMSRWLEQVQGFLRTIAAS